MTKADIQNILVFLNRCQLQGSEAAELVRLQQLLVKEASAEVVEAKP